MPKAFEDSLFAIGPRARVIITPMIIYGMLAAGVFYNFLAGSQVQPSLLPFII